VPVAVAGTTTPCVVVSEVYGGGGNTGAVYNDDFIELHNRCAAPQTLGQLFYRTQTGTDVSIPVASRTVAGGGYYLVAIKTSGTVGADLPNPMDFMGGVATSVDGINATTGSVYLEPAFVPPACPTSVVDLLGYGSQSSCF
jgi:hypothetical protein